MYNHPIALSPALPGGSTVFAIYDSGVKTQADIRGNLASRRDQRVRVMVYTNVADAAFRVRWADPVDGTLRTFSSTVISAATAKDFDVLLQPGRTVIDIVVTTAPSTFQVAAEVVDDPAKSS